jgi:hypothetical protein
MILSIRRSNKHVRRQMYAYNRVAFHVSPDARGRRARATQGIE